MSQRDRIRLSDAEIAAFMDEQRTVIVASNGRDGWPHLMPLWFVLRDGEIWAWTYGKSQKIRNLERDPRATLQIEAGESYDQLRGIMIKARVTLHHELETVQPLGTELYERYLDAGDALPDEVTAMIAKQAPKRVGMQFVAAEPVVSWDHRKLAGD